MYEETQVLDSLKVQPYYNTLAYDIFIDEGIDSPAYYRSVISAINKANEGDSINLFINSGGGLVSTASAIIHAMDRCKGRITAHLVGDCCSAATMISLHADEWEISDNVTYMIHNISFGVCNSAEKVKDHHDFVQQSNRDTMHREYSGLLSDEEIEKVLAGKEYWFNKPELETRLKNFVTYKGEQQSQAMNQMFDQQIAAEDEALDAGLNHLLTSGKVTQAEVDAIKKITPLLDEAFESGEIDLDNLPKSVETSTEDVSDYSNAFAINVKDKVVAICMYTLDEEGLISEAVLDIAEYDDEVIVSNIWLEDNLDRSELITLAKDIGVKGVAHNTKDTSVIINKIINYVDGLIEEEEKS